MKFLFLILALSTAALASPDMTCTGQAQDGTSAEIILNLTEAAHLDVKVNAQSVASFSGNEVTIYTEARTPFEQIIIGRLAGDVKSIHMGINPNTNEGTALINAGDVNVFLNIRCQ